MNKKNKFFLLSLKYIYLILLLLQFIVKNKCITLCENNKIRTIAKGVISCNNICNGNTLVNLNGKFFYVFLQDNTCGIRETCDDLVMYSTKECFRYTSEKYYQIGDYFFFLKK